MNKKDGVSMGSSLRPILATIFMTECVKVIVNNLAEKRRIKFYIRCIDDTLLLVKRQDIDKVLKAFNGFDKNLKFTVDRFDNETPHFLDFEICPNGFDAHEFRLNLVCQNTKIIDESNNWNVLLFQEAYHIKEKCPILNNGVKASKEMQLF